MQSHRGYLDLKELSVLEFLIMISLYESLKRKFFGVKVG